MKRVCYFLAIVLLIVIIVKIFYTFALLESNTTRVVENGLGSWTILVNDTDVTGSEVEFEIDNIVYDQDNTVVSGRLAPGLGGHFDISIDPTDTEVSVRYDITFDYTELEALGTTISVASVSELSGKNVIRTGENTYTGVISLSEIEDDQVDTIRTAISWVNDETKNTQDTDLGMQDNPKIVIPIQVRLIQYTGELIEEYVGE